MKSSDSLKTPLEALLGWRGWFNEKLGFLVGIGRGLTDDGGYGREDFRVFASVMLRGTLKREKVHDRDGDGVPDSEDQCPDVPGEARLDGCPDRDHDDIPDISDKCPDEPGPATNDGCPVKKLVIYENGKLVLFGGVNFDTGKDTIKSESYPVLDEAARVLNGHPELKKVRIDGHTDSVGADEANLGLSKRRAAAVLRYLVEHKVKGDRLESTGFGETEPISDNKTALGRAKNRRVEFTVLEGGTAEARPEK
jgi:outer membrane protein OmpA-like peptidoglycan-associated protein